jgi:hypothetical protein
MFTWGFERSNVSLAMVSQDNLNDLKCFNAQTTEK